MGTRMCSRRVGHGVRRGRLLLAAALLALPLTGGCDDEDDGGVVVIDDAAPAIPAGVRSITGDRTIYLRWIPNREADLAGYRIWRNLDGSDDFLFLDEIGPSEWRFPGPTNSEGDDFIEFPDGAETGSALTNGVDYYYAVTAFDHRGNESRLSLEIVVDTPRPEQVSEPLELFDFTVSPQWAQYAGYDFSSLTSQAQAWNAATTDIFFGTQTIAGALVPFFFADLDRVQIQDYGNVGFDEASLAPTTGWSLAGEVEVILGHTYVLRIYDQPGMAGTHYYAKITVVDLQPDRVGVYWGYQIVPGLIELSVPRGTTIVPALREEVAS